MLVVLVLCCWVLVGLFVCLLILASFTCQRTLRVAVVAGDGCVLLSGKIALTASSFCFLLHKHASYYWLFCSYLLLSAQLLCCVPYLIVSKMQTGNNTKKKLKGKPPNFVNLPLCLLHPSALQCGTFQEEERRPSLSKGIGDCCTSVIMQLIWSLGWVRAHLQGSIF